MGLERLGLVATRWPKATVAVFMLLAGLSFAALTDLHFSSNLDQTFRTDTKAYHQYDAMRRDYSGSQADLIIAVSGRNLVSRDALERIRRLHLDLQFQPGVRAVTSLFSARQPPDGTGYARPVVPARLASADLQQIRAALDRHRQVGGLLLSKGGDLAILRINLDEQADDLDSFNAFLKQVRLAGEKALQGSGLTLQITGLPVMRVDVIAALVRNQVMFVIVAFLLGALVSGIILGSLREMLIVTIPPGFAATMVFGVLWLMDRDINGLTVLIPTLVIVLTLADSMHLVFAIRHEGTQPTAGTTAAAIGTAVRKVGPACVLTSLTTAIALISLLFVKQEFINRFGDAAALCVLLAYVVSVGLTPALARLLPITARPYHPARRKLLSALEIFCDRLGHQVQRRPRTIILIGLACLAAATVAYTMLEPRYIYRDYLPAKVDSAKALQAIDRKLAGTATFRAVVHIPRSVPLNSGAALSYVRRVHDAVAALPEINKVVSIHSLRDWQRPGAGAFDAQQWQTLAPRMIGRLLSTRDHSFLVTGIYTDKEVPAVIRRIGDVQKTMNGLAAGLDGPMSAARVTLTGVYLVGTRSIQEAIGALNQSLLISILLILGIIALALRSALAGLISLIPNLLPVAVGGAWLLITDNGLQLTCVIAFIVGFGLSVDSTIHLLMRHQRMLHDGEPAARVIPTLLRRVGPVVIIASILLAIGAATTMFSDIETLRLFGETSFVILVAALVGDLLLLPALLLEFGPGTKTWAKMPARKRLGQRRPDNGGRGWD